MWLIESQEKMIPWKETNKIPLIEPKYLEIYNLSDKKIPNNHLKELNEMQENTDN